MKEKAITVCVDGRMPRAIRDRLTALGAKVVSLPTFSALPVPVSGHPDLLGAVLPDGSLLLPRTYYETAPALFDSLAVPLCLTDEKPTGVYPGDVLFDALPIGGTLYGKRGAVSKTLLSCYRNFVPVRQGYAKCSVLPVSDRAAITADRGLADALKKSGVEVLLIRPGNILLPGYDRGFIGGAAGGIGSGRIVFFGDPLTHPDGEAILDFIAGHKKSAVSSAEGLLTDYGGLWVWEND